VCVQWQILADTSLPLSSSVPGVTVQPIYHHHHAAAAAAPRRSKQRGSSRVGTWARASRSDADSAGGRQVAGSWLVLGWRFYGFLPRGASKFGCLAYTLTGHSTVGYFTVYKI